MPESGNTSFPFRRAPVKGSVEEAREIREKLAAEADAFGALTFTQER